MKTARNVGHADKSTPPTRQTLPHDLQNLSDRELLVITALRVLNDEFEAAEAALMTLAKRFDAEDDLLEFDVPVLAEMATDLQDELENRLQEQTLADAVGSAIVMHLARDRKLHSRS